jgi:amino acid adenylation domain-containing protein
MYKRKSGIVMKSENRVESPVLNNLSEQEMNLLLNFNNTSAAYLKESTIHQLIEEQAGKTPDHIAMVFQDEKFTYKEINERSNQLARVLRDESVKPDDIIGILIHRSPEMIIGILGVLKAGAAYLPLDPDYPQERINYMLQDSEANVLLTQLSMERNVEFNGKVINIDNCNMDTKDISNIENVNKSTDMAYVIYTSGSTGKPKGVMIEHRSVINFLKGTADKIEFSPEKSVLGLSTISFDIFVLETLLPLSRGLKIILANESEQNNPRLLCELIKKSDVDMFQATPSRIRQLMIHDPSLGFLENIKEVMIGGEAFPPILLEKFKLFKDLKIYNMYGPTETTVWCTISDLTNSEKIDIGQPIANTQIYIVDKDNSLLPVGSEGELCVAGDGLGRGYLNRPELTDEKIVPNPINAGSKMYKTGDIGRWTPEGKLECFGRIDNQIKVRGHRIEPEEIETQLLKYDSIKEAAVSAKAGADGAKNLCAYIVHDQEVNISELKNYLSKILPDYMIPSFFISLDKMPMTPSGKIDRKLLPNPAEINSIDQKEEQVSDDMSTKSQLIEISRSILEGISLPANIGQMSLSDIGFDSISFVRLVVEIEEKLGATIEDELLDYNRFPVFDDLVLYVEGKLK